MEFRAAEICRLYRTALETKNSAGKRASEVDARNTPSFRSNYESDDASSLWGRALMSSSFPAARFPVLPLSKEKGASEPIYKDAVAGPSEPSDENVIAQISGGNQEALA